MNQLLLQSYLTDQGIKNYSLVDDVWRFANMQQPLVIAQDHIMIYELVLFGALENETGKLPTFYSEQDRHNYTDCIEIVTYNPDYAIQVKSKHVSFHRLRLHAEFPNPADAFFSQIFTGYIKFIRIITKL